MRTTIRIAALAAAATALLGGCYVGLSGGAGSVGIELPEPRIVAGTDPAQYARVYVINGPSLLSVGGDAPYREVELDTTDGERVTESSVGPVPAGSGYRVVLVFGDYQTGADDADVFVPSHYAVSDEFSVYAGQATSTETLSPEVTPFVAVGGSSMLGQPLVGIVYDGSDLYTATAGTLYRATNASPGDADPTAGVTFNLSYSPAGKTINSISLGALDSDLGPDGATVWLNTDTGVLPFDNLNEQFEDEFDSNSGGVDQVSILDSGAIFIDPDGIGGGEPLAVYGYLQFDGGLSGVRDRDGGFQPEWLEPIDLSDFVVGRPIYDLAVYNDGTSIDAFFATKLGAFRMPQVVLDPAEPSGPGDEPPYDTAQEIFNVSDFFEVTIDGTKATITQVAVGDADDPSLYLGTPRGAVEVADVGQVGGDSLALPGSVVPGTANLIVEDIAIINDYVVILTNHFLVYSTDAGATFERVPVYASSAGEVSGVLLDSVGGVVLLSGSHGLSGVDIDPRIP
jgi:hypothetical protein